MLERVRRRWPDRLVSLFRPVRRYRCCSIGCAWEGNLIHPQQRRHCGGPTRRDDARVDTAAK
jgi:hypothetical protein